jgi:hypothetical protein
MIALMEVRMSNPRVTASFIRRTAPLFAVVALLAAAPPADAQYCQDWVKNLESVTPCEVRPEYDKYFIPRTFERSGKDYLILNMGNELQLWNVTDSANPVKGSESRFRIPNDGDSDYDLVNYSVCDGCRYGIANFKRATVLFDLGTGAEPVLTSDREYNPLVPSRIGFTFAYGGVQYVLSDDLEDGAGESIHCASGGTPLIRMSGITPGNLTHVGCVEDNAGKPLVVANGHQVTGTPFVYLAGKIGGAFVYELTGSPLPELVHRRTLSSTASIKNKGLEIDPVSRFAAMADGNKVVVLDISDPGNPDSIGAYDTGDLVTTVAVRYPYVFAARRLSFESEHLFRIDDFVAGSPTPIDPNFWQVPNAQNPLFECEKIMGGTFSTDGTHLYTGMWTASKMFDLTGCSGPTAPVAAFSVSPEPAFPADTVTLTNTSGGGAYDECALWVTESEDPTAPHVGGDPTMGSCSSINFTIPANLPAATSYWGHVAVSSAAFPCDPSNPTACNAGDVDQLKTKALSIDRTPLATLSYTPAAPITGDPITLSATAEGAPTSYAWTVTRPDSSTLPLTGANPPAVTLSQSGTWTIDLDVSWPHSGGYTDSDQAVLEISSVAADFTFSDTTPLHNEDLTLTSTSNFSSSTGLEYDWDVLTAGTSTVVAELASCDGGHPGSATCLITAETLDPGTYDFRLTLTKSPDTSVATKRLAVIDGSIDLNFTVSKTTAERGESVSLHITGVPGAVQKATWAFSPTGCPGYTSTMTCDISDPFIFDCSNWHYKWSTSGAKTVTLVEIEVGGTPFPGGISKTVNVLSTGSCDGPTTPTPTPTPPPTSVTCTYTLGEYSKTIPFSGGDYTVAIFQNPSTGTCRNSWGARSETGWLELLSPPSGVGAATVRYRAKENPWPGTRTGSLTIAGHTYTVVEGGFVETNFDVSKMKPDRGETVTFEVDPALEVTRWDFGSDNCDPSDGTGASLDCTFFPAGFCNDVQWSFPDSGFFDVTLTTAAGTKTKTIWVQNEGECPPECHATAAPPADFTMTPSPAHAGQVITFDYTGDDAPTCSYSVSPTSGSFPASGGAFSFDISTGADCPWTVTGYAGWITITSATSGTGPAQVSYTVAANTGEARSSVIGVASAAAHTVTQAAPAECAYTLDPPAASFPAEGGDGSFAVLTDAGCAWTATSDSDWVTITTGSGTGPGTVEYTVGGNSGDERYANIALDGKVHTVAQEEGQAIVTPEEKALAIDFSWSPTSPEIGEEVHFYISGYSSDVRAEWSFGAIGCGGDPATRVCDSSFFDCLAMTHAYASGGTHTVGVTVRTKDGTLLGSVTKSITVQSTGSCGGTPPTPSCSYSLSPPSVSIAAAGDTGRSFNVTTGAECEWTAASVAGWMSVLAGSSGTGNGTVYYAVAANTLTTARSGNIVVTDTAEGTTKAHVVTQAAAEDPGTGEENVATQWRWTVSRGGDVIATSDLPTFEHVFAEPGTYQVELEAGNCRATRSLSRTLEVLEIEEYSVSSAVRTPGLNGTFWMTDLRMYNPCDDPVLVTVDYLPEATNNSTVIHSESYTLDPKRTLIVDDVLSYFPDVEGDSNKGSMRFHYEGNGCIPAVMSRTYNETEQGTFGQAVEAEPVGMASDDYLYLTGLVDDAFYRTNIGIANYGDDDVWATVTLIDKFGDQLGDPISVMVYGNSTRQIVEVVDKAHLTADVPTFSAVVETHGNALSADASVVDEVTGDPVLYRSYRTLDSMVWIPGVARLSGKNDSSWRSDITFLNPYDNAIQADLEYVPDDVAQDGANLTLDIESGNAIPYVDVLGFVPEGIETKGYVVVRSEGDSPLPQIAAKTYNLAIEGGTFGQNLKVFKSSDLIATGGVGFIPGVRHTSSRDSGFRTNFGLLNTAPNGAAKVEVKILRTDGAVAGERTVWLDPGEFKQIDLFSLTGLTDTVTEGSVEFRVVSGGPVAVYASEVDNRTQDPVLIPAVLSIGVN